MAKCIIIAPLYAGEEPTFLRREPGDLLLCADGGYDAAIAAGMSPDLVIGDFDSMPMDHVQGCPTLRLPVHKDDTDLVVCLREGRKRGYREFRLAGCLGGRLDHTFSALQCVYDCALRGETAWICDGVNRATVLTPGQHRLPAEAGRMLSLLAFDGAATDVCLSGTEWPLQHAVLTGRYPLGCSNEFRAEAAELSFASGALLAVYARP